MKKAIIICCLMVATLQLKAQTTPYLNNVNRHTDFISYSTRPLVESRDTLHEQYIIRPKDKGISVRDGVKYYDYEVTLPVSMLERELILRTIGGRNAHAVYANGKLMGSARDSRVPSEINISDALTDGVNSISVAILEEDNTPEESQPNNRHDIEQVLLLARPRLMIYDCYVTAAPDSLMKNGKLRMDVIMQSTYNFEEPFKVGYDVYSPDKKLKDYSIDDFAIAGNATDTITFETTITDLSNRFWSSDNPSLYSLMLHVKRGSLITEYIQFKIGFGTTTWDEKGIYRNGKLINIKPVKYNASATEQSTSKEVTALKKRGFNTIYVSYPQPSWFYEVCNRVGMYVVDCANINTNAKGGDRKVGGTASNNPDYLDDYLNRVQAMYYRNRMYPCVIAWSLGNDSGNGYNMYKAYQWLKSMEDSRPVVYAAAEGEWNSDLELPAAE